MAKVILVFEVKTCSWFSAIKRKKVNHKAKPGTAFADV